MKIIDFTDEWIPQALELLKIAYNDERRCVPALPDESITPDLRELAENGLGAAAVEEGKLLGYVGAYGVVRPVFWTPDVGGVFSPLHAHAVQKEGREIIWRRLYQVAAEKWVSAGAASHAITLFAHDDEARSALYTYGFGLRCMDLMRTTEKMDTADFCYELKDGRREEMRNLRRELVRHLEKSPSFLVDDPDFTEKWLDQRDKEPPRTFVAEKDGKIAAYMEATDDGENFATWGGGVMNICGAYCLPEYRGTGAAQALLGKMIEIFREEGYSRLGVDCESFNPTALGFWTKYFDVYTHSVVRRVDENAVVRRIK